MEKPNYIFPEDLDIDNNIIPKVDNKHPSFIITSNTLCVADCEYPENFNNNIAHELFAQELDKNNITYSTIINDIESNKLYAYIYTDYKCTKID